MAKCKDCGSHSVELTQSDAVDFFIYRGPKFTMDGPDVIEHDGRFYINMGRPGFNSPANNANGYASQQAALAAKSRYSVRRS